jgi:predicted PurR-regulated permease PerM
MVRLGQPPAVASMLLLLLLGALVVFAVFNLSAPAAEWVDRLPYQLRQMEHKLQSMLEPMQRVSEVAGEVDDLTTLDSEPETLEVAVKEWQMSDTIFSMGQGLLSYTFLTLVLLFFMLSYGNCIYHQLNAQSVKVEVITEVSQAVSSYLFTIAVINACLGVAIGVAMHLFGMPNPVLWGIMGGVLNFVPYLGAVVGLIILSFVALISFDHTSTIVAVPLTYFALTAVEGNFITPMVLGRRFTLNPVIIMVWLLFWGWIWGVAGAVIAVPTLMAFKILCENVKNMQWLADLMSVGSVTCPPVQSKTSDPDHNC